MMTYVVRIRADHHRRFAASLRAAVPKESVAFILCRRVNGGDRVIFLSQEVIELEEHEYVRRAADIASVSPSGMARVARIARERGLVVAMMHLHPMTRTDVSFSPADYLGNRRSFRFFHSRIPQKEHISMVWNETVTECAALAYAPDGAVREIESVVTSDAEKWIQHVVLADAVPTRFARQALLLGQEGQRKVGALRAVVAGAGGTGCLASAALIHHGVRTLKIVDDQVLDNSNLPRVISSCPADVNIRFKAHIARDYALTHAPEADVQALCEHVEHPALLHHLSSADVIVVCTDNTTSRAYLNEVSQRYLIPLLDLGVQFTTDSTGAVINEIGRINLVRPGTACLWCTGHITPARLAAEAMPRSERLRTQSYLRGFDDPQPSMLAFNMEVVGRGIQILVGFATGLFAQPLNVYEQRTFIKAKGGSLVRHIGKTRDETCSVCGDDGITGMGDDVQSAITKRAV